MKNTLKISLVVIVTAILFGANALTSLAYTSVEQTELISRLRQSAESEEMIPLADLIKFFIFLDIIDSDSTPTIEEAINSRQA